jgi:hypothetical protein
MADPAELAAEIRTSYPTNFILVGYVPFSLVDLIGPQPIAGIRNEIRAWREGARHSGMNDIAGHGRWLVAQARDVIVFDVVPFIR